ncbi:MULTISPECIES: class I SAM-dependent methyltransferase [Cupriavidus]|jgi:hypothetical protein|uniref:Class I SAM-dependent methyltransferase n=1 Tax=Cupriavidus metallidurans TaxID=119219 RepID=A0A482IQV3_9BURK|nr:MULTISPECIES: class I SAM-dependent methyltransferase [Cupriavidus]QBP10003.1 class I SAM-dependent methyltransferase [Cupriavidus metallidurans]
MLTEPTTVRDTPIDVTLTNLANVSRSDKGTAHPEPHSYTLVYDMLLQPRRHAVRQMLEIGLCAGGPEVGNDAERRPPDAPSVRMWLQYFPNATIHGFDISDFSFFQHPRFHFTRGDSGSAADLQSAIANRDPYDLIIDDGSHASFHQQLAFLHLFPKLRPGGLYIIEDLHWQSPYYESSLPATIPTATLVDHWFRSHTFPSLPAAELQGIEALAADIDFAFTLNQPFVPASPPKLAVIQKRW